MKCIVQSLSPKFNYNYPALHSLLLDHHGIVCNKNDEATLLICSDCLADLSKEKIPRFALMNDLYWGELPDVFTDLTWVVEKICAIYCTSAHVTHLFQSSDPLQPKVFHGNTCAHDMNIVSTASVLPHALTDVTGLLSVIFVGPGKFDPKQLGTIFHVCKAKIWAFLLWLKHHNCLYADIPLDPDAVDLYPDNDMIPGLSDCIVEDHELDATKV
ncbi:hypothetical protein EDC04DRAFT_2578722 [Pisolithus marmoratus]|nr:hypothetical protein EDC04DRAFT_2578722 [Pisolithus marmoratus]